MEFLPFITAAVTEIQQRPRNEDAFDYRWKGGCGCWVMADGLGGHQGGGVASRLAVESIIATFTSLPEVSVEAIERYLQAAQKVLLERQKAELSLSGMRTTIVVLLADPQAAVWAHAGDTRLYHLRQGQIISRTKDHSVAQSLANAGEIRPEEIRTHEDRHRLLRALGQEDDFRPAITKEKQLLEKGDAFLLCTDGFWENVLEAEMEADFASTREPQAWLDKMKSRIMAKALRETDKQQDNFTAMAILYQGRR